jgi:ribokinase
VLVTPDGENAIALSPGANHALTPGDVDTLRPHLRRADVVLLQLELRREVVSAAVDLATDVGTPVVLNLAPAIQLPRSVLEGVQVLVVNRSEAEFLLDQQLSDHDACRRCIPALRELGPAAVVLTAGGQGAYPGPGTEAAERPRSCRRAAVPERQDRRRIGAADRQLVRVALGEPVEERG